MRLATPLILRPLADLPLALLWGGLATSAVGDQLFAVVLTWVAVGAFGTAAGYLTAGQAAVTLLVALFAGGWADRREHRAVMVAADVARAAVLLVTVAVWMASGAAPAWALVACVVVLSAGQGVFRPALQAVIPPLVDDVALLPATNGLLDSTERIARLLGPGLVGLTSGLLPLVHFVTVDAATFLVSAAAVLAVGRLRPLPAAAIRPRETVLANAARGFRTVRRNPILFYLLAVSGVINGSWLAALYLGLPLLIERGGVTGPGGSGLAAFGLAISAYGSTNLAATLVVGNRGVARRPDRMIFGGNLFVGGGIVGAGAAALLLPSVVLLPAFLLCMAFSAIGGPMHDITAATLRQTALPHGDLPAAVRAFMVVNNLGMLVAMLAAPALFDAIGVPAAVMACGAAILAVGVGGLLRFRRVR